MYLWARERDLCCVHSGMGREYNEKLLRNMSLRKIVRVTNFVGACREIEEQVEWIITVD